MSISIKTGTPIRVTRAGTTYSIPIEEWERQEPRPYPKGEDCMGNEVCHRFVLDGYMPQNSSDSIDAYIEVWEYPNGTMEVVDVDVGVNNADAESAICCKVD